MPSDGLFNEERRRAILAILHRDGRVLVKDLAKHFRISQITIRKDLEILDSQGSVQRTHGGALPVQAGALLDPTLREKEKLHRREKARIAEAAVKLVEEGQSVLLDSGTTTTAIARALKDMSRLTVITNAINIAAELAGTHIEVILTGGMLRKNSFSLVGPLAEQTLRQLSADILFLGVDGFDTRAGLFTPNLLEAQVNRAMVEIARRTVAVCDSSKFGRRSLCSIMPVTSVQELITDRLIPDSLPAAVLEREPAQTGVQRGISGSNADGTAGCGMDSRRLRIQLLSGDGSCVGFQPCRTTGARRPGFGITALSCVGPLRHRRLRSDRNFALGSHVRSRARRPPAGARTQRTYYRNHLCQWPAARIGVQYDIEIARRR